MEEVINKSDGQFKDILDDLVDYKKHASKKDPLIKELSRPKLSKPAASLNSSTYSSAASSTSSTSSSLSTSSTSSTSSSPSQSQVGPNNVQDYGKLETAKMEDLGKTAKILEHRLVPSVLSAAASAVAAASSSTSINNNSNQNDTNSSNSTLSHSSAQKFAPAGSVSSLNGHSLATTSGASSWKTINAKRDKRRKKSTGLSIAAEEIPGHKGRDWSVEALVEFIESGIDGTSNSSNNKNSRSKPINKQIKSISKPLQQLQPHQHPQQQPQPQQPKNVPNSTMRQSQQPPTTNITPTSSSTATTPIQQSQPQQQYQQHHHHHQHQQQQQRRLQPTSLVSQHLQQHQSQQPKQPHVSQPIQSQQQQAAVTFANHIKVHNEDVNQYTFGFFDDQSNQQTQQSKLINTNHNSHVNNSRKQTSQFQQPIQNQHEQKQKQVKASPNSEENCYKTNDNVDANSFNYEQILKFISNAWDTTQAQVAAASMSH